MDVRLSSEQQELRSSVERVASRLGLGFVGDLDNAERRARLEAAVTESGWRELRDSGDGDAPLASGVEAAIVAQELGRGLADVAFVGPLLAADLRRRCGAPPATSLETVALRPDLASIAVVEAGAGLQGVGVDAQGAESALVLVSTGSGDGYSLGRVAIGPGAVQMDLTRPGAVVDTSSQVTSVDGSNTLLSEHDVAAWTALGLALTCADLVGVMSGAVAIAVDYASTRRQYDAPVGSFQALQHVLADAHVAAEGSRSVALHAAWAADALSPAEALDAAAVAKAYCARAARSVCETTVQVHGGIGNTWDCLAHVFLRRALLSSDIFGGAEANLERVLESRVGGAHGLR